MEVILFYLDSILKIALTTSLAGRDGATVVSPQPYFDFIIRFEVTHTGI